MFIIVILINLSGEFVFGFETVNAYLSLPLYGRFWRSEWNYKLKLGLIGLFIIVFLNQVLLFTENNVLFLINNFIFIVYL